MVKNFKIWLLSLEETFPDALNTSDMHSNNLNFVSFKRGSFSETGKLILSQKGRSFLFGSNCRNGFVLQSDYVFQTKFCIKICKKPPSWFFISHKLFYISFYIIGRYHFSQLFRTSSFNIIVNKIFVTNFPFSIMDSLKPIYPL